jgi:reactive intermediate/imine deaminase
MSTLPFSLVRRAGNMLFVSGQIGLHDGKLVSASFEEQLKKTIQNIVSLLTANNSSLNRVVDVTAFLTDQADYPKFNEIYAQFFKSPFPTRTTVTVKSLPLEAKVELKVIAEVE